MPCWRIEGRGQLTGTGEQGGISATAYRREIDGLRAIAVLAVVLFHARIRGFPGGFVGVDIFLVISGYLITQLILRESDAGRFTLIGFYERRVRRIMPALLAMLVASGIAAWILLPADFRTYGQSLAAIALFGSNLLFWGWEGYFSLTGEATPLLHTWSLAVEEQFYILFPTLLLMVRHKARTTRTALIAAGLVSFAYGVWALQNDPGGAFYSPLSRAWEFMVGALLATGILPPPRRRRPGDAVALIGLAAIGHAIWSLSERSAFPGANALEPVLGTAAILYGTQAPGSRIGRVLGTTPLVAIGLISYSLYLWHWPLLVFGNYYLLGPYRFVRLGMVLLAFPIAWLSWRYIERPFRKPRLLLPRRTLFLGAAAASGALALYGIGIYLANGLPERFDPAVQHLNERGPEPDYGCAGQPVATIRTATRCRIGAATARPSFVLWGDSHAAVYMPALDMLAHRHHVSGYDLTSLGCPPLLPIRAHGEQANQWMFLAKNKQECVARNAAVMRFLAEERPQVVLLAAHWSIYRGGKHADPEPPDGDRRAFEAGVKQLHALGIAVQIVQDVPDAPFAEPRRLAKAQLLGVMRRIEPARADYFRRDAAFRAITSDLERQGLVSVIEPADRLCGPLSCRITDAGYPLYFDGNHLSARGARFVAPVFEPMFATLPGPSRP
ncbi:acyltransferase [Sphingomonas sp. QA11]|uniref:acyltransferase family protein n=1 Tax=Sphingomonas sp. QA11 TaxID=2950605 RepID=UPI00234AB1A7|nr:acyltransferase family protein [Sphingomonas sp. QA11]WCM26106.1 acyltransferase [Sphingomonas sp. QA11]